MKPAYLLARLLLASCTSPNWATFAIDQHPAVRLPENPSRSRWRACASIRQQPKQPSRARACGPGSPRTARAPTASLSIATPFRQPVEPDSFCNQAMRNVLERQPGRLLARSAFVTPAGKGIEVNLSQVPTPDNQAAIQYVRTVLVGRAAYTFTFRPSEGQDAQTTE